MAELTLYDFYRSSSAYRVRIALNVKGLAYRRVPVNLVEGQQHQADYRKVNPQGLVPLLVAGDTRISQSVAIMEWLEHRCPEPALLPGSEQDKALLRSLTFAITMDIQPLNNLRVMNYFKQQWQWSEEQVGVWYQHWIATGFSAIEAQLAEIGSNGKFCFGDGVTMADVCLVPQVYNARRFHCDLSDYPLIRSIDRHCTSLDAFARATPEAIKQAEDASS